MTRCASTVRGDRDSGVANTSSRARAPRVHGDWRVWSAAGKIIAAQLGCPRARFAAVVGCRRPRVRHTGTAGVKGTAGRGRCARRNGARVQGGSGPRRSTSQRRAVPRAEQSSGWLNIAHISGPPRAGARSSARAARPLSASRRPGEIDRRSRPIASHTRVASTRQGGGARQARRARRRTIAPAHHGWTQWCSTRRTGVSAPVHHGDGRRRTRRRRGVNPSRAPSAGEPLFERSRSCVPARLAAAATFVEAATRRGRERHRGAGAELSEEEPEARPPRAVCRPRLLLHNARPWTRIESSLRGDPAFTRSAAAPGGEWRAALRVPWTVTPRCSAGTGSVSRPTGGVRRRQPAAP